MLSGIYSQTTNELSEKWKSVDQLLDEQLPESALKNLVDMQLSAEKTQNKQALIKVQLYRYRIQIDKEPDTAPKVFNDFEHYISTFEPSAEKQLLYDMLAELYFTYYQNNQYVIQQRTEMAGELPLDMETWTKNHFQQKITLLLNHALKENELIQQTPIASLEELIVQDKELLALTPTLYDLIVYKKIELMKAFKDDEAVKASYEELIQFRRTKNATALLVLAEVNYYKELYQEKQPTTYITKLDSLEKVYKVSPAVVEVLYEQTNYYLQHTDIKGNTKRAYEISKEGLQNYPDYFRIGLLKNIIHQIETKSIQLKGAQAAKPNSHLKLELETKNISSITLEIFKLNTTAKAYLQASINRGNKAGKITDDKILKAALTLAIPLNEDFQSVKTNYLINTEDYGIYEYIVYPTGMRETDNMAIGYFTVTDFSFIARNIGQNKKAYYVVDRQSGKRLKGVTIDTYTNKWAEDHYTLNPNDNGTTNCKGYVEINQKSDSRNEIVIFKKGEDQFFSTTVYSTYFTQTSTPDKQEEHIGIFTDRAIYRPGQTVHFKTIAYQSSVKLTTVISNKVLTLELIDANGNSISSKQLKTNQFGSASDAFILPSEGLNGTYQIRANNQFSESFLVEAYKRPSFEVLLTQPENEISFGSTVNISGEVKAYAGYAMPNTQIKYLINRYVHPYWRWAPVRDEMLVASGETITDKDGKFIIAFTPEKDNSISDKSQKQSYQYKIQVNATDQKGESQQGIAHISVSEESLFILAEIPPIIDKQTIRKLNVSTATILGKKTEQEIGYQLFSLATTEEYLENLPTDFEYTSSKTVLEGKYNTQSKALAIDCATMKSGRYKIEFTATDKSGNEVKSTHVFVLYDKKDKRPPITTYAWLPTSSMECVPEEKASVVFGTSARDAHVLFEVMHGNEVISSKWIKMSNNIRTFKIPFAEQYKTGISVHFTFVKDERLMHKSVNITEKRKDKKLNPILTVFRDKLLPGEHATWTINIPELAVNHNMAELLVGMYDASLDAIQPHQWNFNPTYAPTFPFSATWMTASSYQWITPVSIIKQTIEVPTLYTPDINWFGLNIANNRQIVYRKHMTGGRISINVQDAIGGMNEIEDVAVLFSKIQKTQLQSLEEITQTPIKKQIRTNFNETAFFYPHLYNDSLGNYNFSFSVPESLTRWKMKMLAHTKDLYVGQGEATVVTQQDLMVQLNMPRFVRRSDKIILSANVVNLSDKDLKTVVRLQFIDPASNNILLLNDTNAVTINLAPGASQSVAWETKGFEHHELLICKIVANAGSFSDGEQKYLAVLPDKVLVTESYPISIKSGEEKHYTFDKINQLSNEVETQQLMLEFSANPIWYAIQALPALAAPKSENAIDYYIAWYVNTLASKIIADHPRIKEVFELISQTENKDALQSALSKNQELKNILLEETPWLQEAKNETEQQQRIALLFELNQQSQQRALYFDQLSKLQLPNGAFEWFKGMGENRWVTQWITEGLSKTAHSSSDQNLRLMIQKAMEYLDSQLAKDYHHVKQNVKDYDKVKTITALQLQYLTMRTPYKDRAASVASQDAIKYYLGQTETYRHKFGLYEKSMAALILYQSDKKAMAEGLMKSLKENAIKSATSGMYWANNKAGYFWSERPISVHTHLMEAFATITGNSSDMDEMKVWLLQQKQTQQWDSPITSVEAIDALLKYGNNWSSNSEQYSFKLGDKTLTTNQGVPGTGYIRQTVNIEDLKNGITISTTGKPTQSSPAWGSLYWQYYHDMDKVTASGTTLKVEKQLFVERLINNKKTLIAINVYNTDSDKEKVTKGDKLITRMVVTTDRNLEFVALKDNRAGNLEPINQLSGCHWKENTVYYRTMTDASTNYFFNYLPKGTYVFEDEYFVNVSGEFSGGTASIQCLYAPEFIGTSAGERMIIE